MANYISNHTPTSSLSGWTKTAGTLTATADGARWVTSSGSVKIQASDAPNDTAIYLAAMQIRRNTASSTWPDKVFIWDDGRFSGSGSEVILRDVDFPVGVWVTIPTIGMIHNILDIGFGQPVINNMYATIMGPESGTMDCTFKHVTMYGVSGIPGDAIIDTNDSTFTCTQANNSLTLAANRVAGNEAVAVRSWNWGDGTTTSGPAAGSGQRSTGLSKTYSAPGVYTVQLTSTAPPRLKEVGGVGGDPGWTPPAPPTSFTTQSITVPVGTFQAGFDYQVNYPDVLVDASPSIAPSLSPIQTYAWNWGDGTTGSGLTASHTYDEPGSYNVTLTISNDDVDRSSSITKSAVMSAPPLPITAPQFAQALFLDDPASVTGAPLLQAEMIPLIYADNIQWNWTRNEVPTMSFQAPTNWLDLAVPGLTLESLESDIVIRLNYGAGWVEPPMGRFIVDTIKRDPLNPQQVVTVNCVGIAADDLAGIYFTPGAGGDAYTPTEVAAGYSRAFSSVKPGKVVWDLMPVATTPGTGAPYLNYLNVDFSQTVDSKGAAWSKTLDSLSVPPDASGLDLMQTLIDMGSIDWYCKGNLLRMFNPRSSGIRGDADGVPELLPGRDIKAAPQEQNPVRSNCWGAVVVGDGKVPYTVTDTVSSNESYQRAAYRGRRYVAIQASDVASDAAALAAAKPTLENIYRSKDGQMVRELRFYDDMPWMPYRDYHVGDYVLAPGPDGSLVVVSVEGITLQQDAQNGIRGSLILGNAFTVNSLQKKVASLAGGAGVTVGQVRSAGGGGGGSDSGWIDAPKVAGGGILHYRKIGDVVYWEGNVTGLNMAAGATVAITATGAIPAEFRPGTTRYIPSLYGDAFGYISITNGGTVSAHASTGAMTNASVADSYPVG